MVMLPIYTIHRDPTLWNDPEVFDPERWNEENVAASSTNFFAFSHGPRTWFVRIHSSSLIQDRLTSVDDSIGQQFFWNEVKIIIPMLLAKFTLSIENKGEVKPTDKHGSMKPAVPIRVRFTKRRR